MGEKNWPKSAKIRFPGSGTGGGGRRRLLAGKLVTTIYILKYGVLTKEWVPATTTLKQFTIKMYHFIHIFLQDINFSKHSHAL